MAKRIYVSAMESQVPGRVRFDPTAEDLFDRLESAGFDVYWNKSWRPYEDISAEIAASDAMLAVVDPTWTSSTWMAIEICLALGEHAFGPAIRPIPVFVYPVSPQSEWGFLRTRLDALKLPRNVEAAFAQVKEALSIP